MNKNNSLTIKILLICLTVLFVLYFIYDDQQKNKYQWGESYKATSDQPYGTLFIQKLLKSQRSSQKFILNDKQPLSQILDSTHIKTRTDYVLIGQDIYLNSDDRQALLNFIATGNDAFISTLRLPFDLLDSIFQVECGNRIFLMSNDTTSVNLNLFNSNLKTNNGYNYAYRFGKKDQAYYWNFINPDIFCESTKAVIPLGYIDPDKANFLRLTYGKGNLYIHCNPLAFTNYFLTKAEKAEYVSSVFSYLQGKEMIWDEFSKSEFSENNAPPMSPIAYILQHDSLRYAWWLMLFGALLYTLFTAKRRQRIIPVLDVKANTSLEFVNMVSALHFQNANHHDIAKKKIKYFFHFIRTKYAMHTQDLNESYLKRLAEKSKVEQHHLERVAYEFSIVERKAPYPSSKLMDLYNALDKFYKTCK